MLAFVLARDYYRENLAIIPRGQPDVHTIIFGLAFFSFFGYTRCTYDTIDHLG